MSMHPDHSGSRGSASLSGWPIPTGRPERRVPNPVPDRTRVERWRLKYALMVVLTDMTIITVCVLVAVVLGLEGTAAADRARVVSGVLAAVLLPVCFALGRAWDSRILGVGTEETKRLVRGVVTSVVLLGLGGLAFMVDSVRPWVFGIVPMTGALCLAGRFVLRKWLHRQRVNGRCTLSVLAVGDEQTVTDLVQRTHRDPYFGWRVEGVCTPTGRGTDGADSIAGVPVVGDLDTVGIAAHRSGYDVVTVSQAAGWGPTRLHQLAWQLEGTDTDLAVDPGLMEIAGPRLHITPVDGMPLLRLSKPRFTGGGRLLKAGLERPIAAVLLLLTLPVFVGVAVAIWCSDRGPVFFRQERVGARGRTFHMIKFRSMCRDAEGRRVGLVSADEGAGPMFKLRHDPRVTRVGRVLRKYSLDELPQLLNVLHGSMSLVGPRPPLPSEVVTYAEDAQRRLLVRPGMTGLWQVSGRSTLSWEETVRLDLRYVENWSISLDLIILWKTVGAVVRNRGAY